MPNTITDNIIVNDMMFCREHGEEYCHRCYCDHRMCNNTTTGLGDKLAQLVEDSDFDLDVC